MSRISSFKGQRLSTRARVVPTPQRHILMRHGYRTKISSYSLSERVRRRIQRRPAESPSGSRSPVAVASGSAIQRRAADLGQCPKPWQRSKRAPKTRRRKRAAPSDKAAKAPARAANRTAVSSRTEHEDDGWTARCWTGWTARRLDRLDETWNADTQKKYD